MNSDLIKWEDAAAGWDKDIAQENTYRTLLIDSAMEVLVSDCSGKLVLDAGCGNGYYSNWLKKRGAKVIGVDGSAEMIKIAKQKYPDIKFEVQDLMDKSNFKDSSFDLVLANMLLMHMQKIDTFLADAKRLLKPGGHLIFSVLHPAFNQPTAALYKSFWNKMTFARPRALMFDYYSHKKGRFESHFKTDLTHYHRTIGEYAQSLANAGFSISNIVEPHELPDSFLKTHPKLEYATRLPRFIFFKCQ